MTDKGCDDEMTTTQQAFTYGDITYTLPVELQSLVNLTLVQAIGDHVEISLTGIAPETLTVKDIEKVTPQAPVEINLAGRDQPYFAGMCTNVTLNYQAGVKTVHITGRSWTYLLDITKKSRSYQKLNIPYEELVADILKDYPEKDYRIILPDGGQYSTFAVQYWETDWQFLKRLAAREGTVLIAEYADKNHRPRFWLGIPKISAKPLPATPEQTACRDIKQYLDIAGNRIDTVQETDFTTYEDSGYQILHLGETVDYNGRQLTIVKIITRLDKGLLKHTYTLASSEKMAMAAPDNENLTGVALSGKVLTSGNIHSKVHLDIDEKQDVATATWFPYSAATNNQLYCMPHNGEVINLYFRDGYEENAIAISGARSNGQTCEKTGDYNNRYFTNFERKEFFFSPNTLSFTADESAASKITIRMTDAEGTAIDSVQQIGISGGINIKLEAENIAIEGVLGTYITCGDNVSIILKEDADIFGPTKIHMNGRNKIKQSELETQVETVEHGIDDFREEHPYLMAVVEMTPLGSLVDAYDAYKCIKKGDWAGAALNASSAVIGIIPAGRVATKVAKGAIQVGLAGGSVAHAYGAF